MNFYNLVQNVTVCRVHFNNGVAIKSVVVLETEKVKGYKIKMVSKDHFFLMWKYIHLSNKP